MLKETLQRSSLKSMVQSSALLGMTFLVVLIAACSTPKKTAPVRDYSSGRKTESSSTTAKTAPVPSSKTTTKADPVKSTNPKMAKEASKEASKETPKETPKETTKELAKSEPKSKVEAKTEPKVDAKSEEVKKNTSTDTGLKLVKPASGQTIGGFDGNTNKGIDISGKVGDPIVAAADGKVVYAGDGMRGYGNIVIVKHDNNYLTVYAHNKSLVVKEGSTVKRGQKIAEMGNSESDRVKLHFELRRDGKPIDPTNYLQ